MAQNRPPAPMDPPHITEFASERYFEKLNQLNAKQQKPEPSAAAASNSVSGFILPLRESKLCEAEAGKLVEQKREKSRFFNIRSKVPLRHPKPGNYESDSPDTSRTPSWTEAGWKSAPFDQLFLALPNELQVQILSSLLLTDLLSLRRISRSWHTLVTLNESPLVRYHLEHHIPAYALRLYPITDSHNMTFHFLCNIWHRLHVAAKLAFLMCEWITKDIFLRQSEAQRLAFALQRERMRRRLIPLLFTIFHSFEMYRTLHLKHIAESGGHGLRRTPYTVNPIEKEIMDMYDDQTLLRVHEVFPLVISSFCRRLRPPTYVGRVERSLRGYLRERPSDDIYSAILCVGGLRQVERLWEIKGYNSRRAAVDTWYHGLTKEPAAEASTRLRLGLKSFGRKKPACSDGNGVRSSLAEGGSRVKGPPGSMDAALAEDSVDSSWIFSTSLAADRPMGQLGKEHAHSILSDILVLQQIWLTTAEAMILDRGILQRTQDIKRNQQVMLDLIREDGMNEEDEWWYGRNVHESIRPPLGATDDDAD